MKVKSFVLVNGITIIRLDESWADIARPLYNGMATIDGKDYRYELLAPRQASPACDGLAIEGEPDIRPGTEITLS